ncbi:MAG: 6-phosphogluconolactonase [Actinobacteria bacterium]|nr:6-phosphogluconolactonase [Actinomycetota bacterium]MBU1492538.1 6-phosphogluconolactonase [Actinomycetota bacterium]MBU1865522.1 6-phosphogluconolactonase [Actinomycetota bacterium]
MRIRIFDDPDRLAEAAAQEIETWVSLTAPHATIGLAGGRTPLATYRRLRRTGLPWNQVHGWMTDERFVPATDPASNTGMVAEALFDHVPATLHRIPWIEDPMAAAAAYEQQLHGVLEESPTGLKPSLVLLGVGEDGHTASLFPGTDALDVTDRDYLAHWVPQQEAWRLTATLPLLMRARRTMFLVSGARKAQIVADVLEGDSDHPAAIVSRGSKDAVWLLDREAARLLPV